MIFQSITGKAELLWLSSWFSSCPGHCSAGWWEMLWKIVVLLFSIHLLLQSCREVAFQVQMKLNSFGFLFMSPEKCQSLLSCLGYLWQV